MKLLRFLDSIIDTFGAILEPLLRPMTVKLIVIAGAVILLCYWYQKKSQKGGEEENEKRGC